MVVQCFTFMLLQPIPHHIILPKASTAIYSLSKCTQSHWPSPGHGFLLIHLFVFTHADFLQTGWCLQLISAQSSSAHALLLPDQCSQKIPTTLAMAGRRRQKKSRDGKECTMFYSRHRLHISVLLRVQMLSQFQWCCVFFQMPS